MSQERLLKRIQRWSDGSAMQTDIDLDVYTRSLLEDMDDLLNVRKGSVMIDEELGLPDLSKFMSYLSPSDIEQIAASLISVLNRYETRVKLSSVTHVKREDDFGLLRFAAEGSYDFNRESHSLYFDILLRGNGSIYIQTGSN